MSAKDNTDPDEPRRKAQKTHRAAYMNSQFRSPDFASYFADSFLSKSQWKDEHTGVEVFTTPFRHASLPNFVPDKEYLEQLIVELSSLDMNEKNNDLYKFKQSMELKHVNSPCINIFRDILQEQLLPWFRDVTRFPLNDKVDMFCSNYDYTDTLLCHDDELEERYIAYIYYLVPDSWCQEDGGTLDLFDTDDKGQPNNIVKSIVPAKNLFLFFEVSPGSFHQVAEVLAEDKTRLAISGWFHGPPVRRPPPYVEPPMPVSACGSIKDDEFFDWINPVYLSQDIQNEIRERFEAESELELTNFLKEEKYEQLLAALSNQERTWTHRGPPNKRNYDVCLADHLPPTAESFLKVLQSDAMFLVLSAMTGLHLYISSPREAGEAGASDARGDNAKCRVEVQRFKHGSYTLLHDTDPLVGEMALDIVLFVGGKEWSAESGGYMSYVAKDAVEEDSDLLKAEPSPNSLALVYKDRETLRFIKHINHRATKAKESQYYAISATYYENAD
ncbi:prolyl 3-hydroxylase OGFOD1-like [Babylonia areolata]|uniref:prolyl 3-hydroxylase OGFOD1-like n=1 Tax=Babylonia areolata TaxID=304850 RepID=UPI003FD04B3C